MGVKGRVLLDPSPEEEQIEQDLLPRGAQALLRAEWIPVSSKVCHQVLAAQPRALI